MTLFDDRPHQPYSPGSAGTAGANYLVPSPRPAPARQCADPHEPGFRRRVPACGDKERQP
jgi:hypothetical protein